MKRQRCHWVVTTLLALVAPAGTHLLSQEPTSPAAAALKSHIMLTPGEIKWGSCPAAVPRGAQCAVVEGDMRAANKLFAFRLQMPDGFRVPPHFHPADEHLVVISGTFALGMGDKLDTAATRPMTAGSFIVLPKGTHHFVRTIGETIIQVYAIGPWGLTYINPEDDPRNQKVQ